MKADAIAGRAFQHIGTTFRLFGRDPEWAVDCVGLTAAVLEIEENWSYSLKGDYLQMVADCLETRHFRKIGNGTRPKDGDIALALCAPRQQHLLIRANGGWVHAHAGLGRVVHTPGDCPWPIIALWRISGD